MGREINLVRCPDPWYLKAGLAGPNLAEWLRGRTITSTGRRGKLMWFTTSDDGPVVGLRFGMTGRLIVDGVDGIGDLVYGSNRRDDKFVRFELGFVGGGTLVMSDPRRLGGVEAEPDVDSLGREASTITLKQLRGALGSSKAPLKAVLLDQSRIAGLGNLLCDEILWRAKLHPGRRAGALTAGESAALARTIVATVRALTKSGGSHTGDIQIARLRGGSCPRCGSLLGRDTIGGRTTYWCTQEQLAAN